MANPTSNFGWQMPTPTDLVTSLPADFEVFGQAVDSSMADLKGGTTGQILAKATNTDMDFTWVTNDVGDITAVTAGTGLTGGGTTGAVSLAFDQANYGGGQYAAGKNKIINGAFNFWARGISFTTSGVYCADRFYGIWDGTGTKTISQQTFTPATAPVSGYEGQYFLRFNQTVAGTSGTFNVLSQKIEDVRTFAGQTATLSFWAKAGSSISMNEAPKLNQGFGSGGSGTVVNSPISGSAPALTTSWQRFSFTYNVASISGKTIGTNSSLNLEFYMPLNTTFTIDIWGVQVESGSIATPFQTASGSIQGELALCQRYYYRATFDTATARLGVGYAISTVSGQITIPFPVTMRTSPSALEQSGTPGDYSFAIASGTAAATAGPFFEYGHPNQAVIRMTTAGGLTAGQAAFFRNVNTSAYLGWSAEL